MTDLIPLDVALMEVQHEMDEMERERAVKLQQILRSLGAYSALGMASLFGAKRISLAIQNHDARAICQILGVKRANTFGKERLEWIKALQCELVALSFLGRIHDTEKCLVISGDAIIELTDRVLKNIK